MIFNKSKYTKWYFNIIEKAKANLPNKDFEKHHILPKSLGGSNEEDNLVSLTYRDHFVCHLLLTKMCINLQHEIKMCWALHKLTFSKNKYSMKMDYSSHQYELARKIHIKNLKENHPSKKQSWRDTISECVFNHWENNEERKRKLSQKTKERYASDPDKWKEISIKNLPDPMIGKDNPRVKSIDYNGKIYYGWRELLEQTGVSKHLYKKYYLNGVDPTFRIGTDGPISQKKGESLWLN